ncbi:MAG: UvrD-helicase domain-containing protein [Bacteroidia bacterium]
MKGTQRLMVYRASAGSGKTHRLVTTYLRLVLASSDPLSLRQTLAITFTQKAAHEMKERILDQLKKMGDEDPLIAFSEDSIRLELLKDLQLEEEELRQRSRQLHRTMLHRYSDAAIGTIDSFITQMARPFYRELRSGQDFEIELDRDVLIEKAMEPFLAQVGQADHAVATLLMQFSQHLNRDEKSWNIRNLLIKYAAFLFQDRAYPYLEILQKISPSDYAAYYDRLQEILQIAYQEQSEGATRFMEELAEAGISEDQLHYGTKGLMHHLRKLQQNESHTLHKKVDEALRDENRLLKSGKHPTTLQPWVDQLILFIQEQKNSAKDKALMQGILDMRYATTLLGTMYQHFTDYSRSQVKMPLNFLYFQLADLVQDTHPEYLCDRVGHRYINMLLDEFQDTSLLQWQCLEPLMDNGLASGGTAMVVGDVKQSIYRWRNGDARLLASLPAKRWDQSPTQLWLELYQGIPLQTNYRSCNNVLYFNNVFFDWCLQQYGEFLADTYQEVKQDQPDQKPSLPPWEGRTRVFNFDPTLPERSLESNRIDLCYRLIQEYKDSGIPASEIAILVRTNRTGSALAQGLIQRGQAVISPDNLLLGLNPKVRLLVHTWFHLHSPQDSVYAEALLRDLDPEAYLHHLGRGASQVLMEKFTNLHPPTLLQLPLSAQMQALAVAMGATSEPGPFVQRLLDEWNTQCAKGPRQKDLEDWWRTRGNQIKIQWAGSEEAVQLMTVHSAKGLQFKVVLVAEMDRKKKRPVIAQQWINHVPSERWGIQETLPPGLVPVHLVSNSALKNAPEDYSKLADSEEQLNDLDYINVLYVALTRAKTNLEILTEIPRTQKESTVISMGQLWGKFLQTPSMNLSYWTHKERDTQWPGEPETWSLVPTLSSSKKPISAAQPVQGHYVTEVAAFPKPMVSLAGNMRWPNPASEAIEDGILLHRLMAQIQTLDTAEKTLAEWGQDQSIPLEQRQKLEGWARTLIQKPELQVFYEGKYTVLREHPLLLTDGSTLKPDLILLNPQGQSQVVDFKTGKVRSEHQTQVDRYVEVLQQAGYPCTGSLVYVEG